MNPRYNVDGKLDKALDKLATSFGILVVLGVLLAFGLTAGLYVKSVAAQLEENHSIFKANEARNGYVAMSDMQRLILVAQQAVALGEVTPHLEQEFQDAADMMYVRTDNFRRVMNEGVRMESGVMSVAALEALIDITDQNILSGFPDNTAFLNDLIAAASEARSHLVQFLDDMRRQANTVLEVQSDAVQKQRMLLFANLIVLTLFGVAALVLLRREVIGRRDRRDAEERVQFLAFFDPLTELPNRTQFQDYLQKKLITKRKLALLLIDLDDFKLVNDTYGHNAGDTVLRHLAGILAETAGRLNGFAARLGGDEFALILPTDNIAKLVPICETLLETVAQPFRFEGESFAISVSIGLATSTQVAAHSKTTVDMLTRVTDFALYASKANGRRCYTVYDQQLEQRFWERRGMVDELPGAIANGDLEVFLQPKVRLPHGEIYGFEALVRWMRNGKLTPPGEFILIAEESGLVVDLDYYVLEKATQMIAAWNRENGTGFSVSVNLSALHFGSEKVVGIIESAIWSAALSPQLLTLEITESMEMRDWGQAQTTIAGIKEVGCKIAIDDFGTGYTSLAYLRTIAADELKIDRSLIEELETSKQARLLLASVLEIARNFELRLTVEGIETRAQAEIVHNMGVSDAQGYFFGHPQPACVALDHAMTHQTGASAARAS